jgi:hypothetical protein
MDVSWDSTSVICELQLAEKCCLAFPPNLKLHNANQNVFKQNSKMCTDKHLCDAFRILNSLKQGDALFQLLLNFVWCVAVGRSKKVSREWN